MLLLRKLLNKILNFFIESLDFDCLFTNIQLEEILTFALTRFENTKRAEGLSKIKFKKLLSLATKEYYFIFNGKLCKQVDGFTMGSPLDLSLVNAFLVNFEKNWMKNCRFDCKPHYYRRYVENIFVFFTSPEHLEAFQSFLNGRHALS